jgi:hypothetical protein
MAKNDTKYIDESTSVEDASQRGRRHKRGMKRAKLGVEREERHGVMRGYGQSYARSGPNNDQLVLITALSASLALFRMSSDSLLPGQPVPLPHGPKLKLGSGIYTRNGETRASLFGTPLQQGSVGLFSRCFDSTLNDFSRSSRLPDLDNTSRKTPSTCTELHCIRFHHPTIPSTSRGLHHRCGRRTTPTRGGLYGSYSCARYPCNGEGQS